MQRHLAITVDKLSWGGIQRVLFELAKEFIDRDILVDFVVCESGGTLANRVPPGVRVFQLKRSFNISTRWYALRADIHAWRIMLKPVLLSRKPPGYMVYLPSFVHYLKSQQPHAILSAGRTLNIATIWARKLAKISSRVVLSEHVAPSSDLRGSRKWGRRYLTPLMAHNYAMGDCIIAVSDGVADDLAAITGLPRESIHTIYNPIVSKALLESAKHPIQHPWFEPGQPPVILGAGRLVEQKDFKVLVKAFGLLRKKRDARLIILGSAKDDATTKKRRNALLAIAREMGVADDVCLPGYVEHAPAYMSKASLFVLSSAYEGFGNVLVEALALGCPVVSTNCPSGPSEILENGKWGALVPVGDYEALAQAMARTLDRPIGGEDLRRRGAYFNASHAADRYAQLLFPA